MNNFIKIFILIILLFNLNCKKETTVYSWTDDLRIRSKPTIESEVIGKASKDESLLYLQEKDKSYNAILNNNKIDGFWLKVKTNSGKTGWIFSGGLECSKSDNIDIINNYEILFKDQMPKEQEYYYISPTDRLNLYLKPHLGTNIYKSIKGPYYFNSIGESKIPYQCFNSSRTWIKTEYEENHNSKIVYILKDSVILYEDYNKYLRSKLNKIAFFNKNKDNKIIQYKSKTKYDNGDAGISWKEESALKFEFEYYYSIYIGYMYESNTYDILDLSEKDNLIVFTCKERLYAKKILEIKIRVNNDDSIELINLKHLSGKYFPGEAEKYPVK